MDELRKNLKNKKKIVVKIGTTTITHADTGRLDLIKLEKLVRVLTNIRNQGREIVLVSSGAIAVGRQAIGLAKKPEIKSVKQACAAIGQARLMMVYQKLFAEYNQMTAQVLMTKYTIEEQPLFMGGKIRAAHQAAKFGEELAEENIRLNRSEVLVELEQAYWQCVRVQELVLVARKYKSVVNELVKNLEDAQQAGMAPLNDVLKAQVKYNDALLQLQQAEHGKQLAQMNRCRLVGLDLNTELVLTDSLSATITPVVLALPDGLEQRPDYNMLEKQVEMKRKEINVTRADFLPQVGVSAGYGYGGGLKLNGDDSNSGSFSAMASVAIPIFNWGEGRNKVRVAKAEEEMSRLNKERLGEMMRLEIAGSRFKLNDAQTRIRLTESALEQAKENLRVSEDQYEVGMENLTNLLEAQAQWQQAWSEWVDAKAALKLCESEYLKAIGKLE